MKKKAGKVFPKPDEVLGSHYHHVDNGGLTMKIVKEYLNDDLRYPEDHSVHLRIIFSHMTTETTIDTLAVTPASLREFAVAFMEAATKLEHEGIKQ